MKKSTYENLTLAGYIAEQALQVRKFVATQEQGKKYMLAIQEKHPSTVFQIDGYIIKTNLKCDKLVMVQTSTELAEAWTQIFVELKGHDSIHGMEQLLATAKNPILASSTNHVRKARLVATSFPANKSNPKVEKLKIEFAKMKVDYKIIEFHFLATLLASKGSQNLENRYMNTQNNSNRAKHGNRQNNRRLQKGDGSQRPLKT